MDTAKIYVPDLKYKCYVLQDKDTIRAYEIKPYNPSYNQTITIKYRDYYINSHYLYRDSQQNFGYSTTLPICLDNSLITDEVYYRNDFDSILIIFVIMCLFSFYLPIKIFIRLFRRWQ